MLKRNVSLRWFFRVPTSYVWLINKKLSKRNSECRVSLRCPSGLPYTCIFVVAGLNFECLPAQEVRLWTTGGLLISIPGCVGKQNMASPVTITFSDCSNMEMVSMYYLTFRLL